MIKQQIMIKQHPPVSTELSTITQQKLTKKLVSNSDQFQIPS